ncbi:MAG: methylated-DNA--[protein]-cysteine S-methyltransferase [Verrucomicrobiota bacterium]
MSLPTLTVATEDGIFIMACTTQGVCRLEFPVQNQKTITNADASSVDKNTVRLATAALQKILNGKTPDALPPLDLSAATPFRQRVWRELQKIPPGTTKSYAAIARAIGSPQAARAVGAACGANPIPLFIPCHRVITTGGKLGGFSAGLRWKRLLLEREAAACHSSLPAATS